MVLPPGVVLPNSDRFISFDGSTTPGNLRVSKQKLALSSEPFENIVFKKNYPPTDLHTRIGTV